MSTRAAPPPEDLVPTGPGLWLRQDPGLQSPVPCIVWELPSRSLRWSWGPQRKPKPEYFKVRTDDRLWLGRCAPDHEPTLHEVTAWVCSLCLDGAGGECHVPGCLFVFADAPLPYATGPTLREKIGGVGSIDGVTTYPALTDERTGGKS